MAEARFGPPVDAIAPDGFSLTLDVITMVGAEFVLMRTKESGDAWGFPSDTFHVGESPADAARRVVTAWTQTRAPKLELVDWRVSHDPWEMAFVFRALLIEEPKVGGAVVELKRMNRAELAGTLGRLDGAWVQDALKTGLNYKLTRAALASQ